MNESARHARRGLNSAHGSHARLRSRLRRQCSRPARGRPIVACSAIVRPHREMFLLGVLGAMLFAASMVSFAKFAQAFGDGTFENRDPSTIVWLPLALIGLFALRGLGDFMQTYCMGHVGRHVVKRLRTQIFERMMQLPIGYYDRNSSSVLLSRLTYNTEQVGQAATDSVVVTVREALTVFGSIACAVLPQCAPGADRDDDGPAGRVAGHDHQSQVPPLQPAHPGLDGRHHARREGNARRAARHQGLQRAGLSERAVRGGQRAQPPLVHAPGAHQGSVESGRAAGDGARFRRRAVDRDRRRRARPQDDGRAAGVPRGAGQHQRSRCAAWSAWPVRCSRASRPGRASSSCSTSRRSRRAAIASSQRVRGDIEFDARVVLVSGRQGRHAARAEPADSLPASCWRSSARPAAASRRWSTCCRGSTTSTRARCASMATMCASTS